jgi:hypothetical protein
MWCNCYVFHTSGKANFVPYLILVAGGINPVYKYTKTSENDSKEHIGFTELKYDATAGVKEFYGTELKNKYGIGRKITEYAPSSFVAEFMHVKLLEHSIANFETSMKELEIK